MKGLLLAGILVAALLAGCAQTSTTSTSTTEQSSTVTRYSPPFDTMPEGAGHDHADASQHKFLWHYNFTARDPLLSNTADIAGLHAIDLQAGYLFGAVYGSHAFMVDGGVQIWDVKSDPAHPKELGRWTIPGSVGGDRSIGATVDGDYVVIGTEPIDCLGHVNPAAPAASAYLIDARDKTHPVVSDFINIAGGTIGNPTAQHRRLSTHSVFVARIGEQDYASIFGDLYRIDRTELAAARLVYVSHINTGHDVYIRQTPWNTTWALSANGGGGGGDLGKGLVIFDITDPAKPFEIGEWDRADHNEVGYYFHTADVDFVGNQTLVLLSSEDFGPHVSPFWVLDGNPLSNVTAGQEPVVLTQLGEWHNPYNHTAANIRFSLHNPRWSDHGILTLASYHAGFFQFDMRDPSFWENPSLVADGAYADGTPPAVIDPVEQTVENTECALGIDIDAPEYMDVAVGPHGVLYFGDVFMGLYTFVPSADHPLYGKNTANPL
ncbi:MAG: hypothetical protein V4510_11860 [bacterium]